MVVIYYKLPQSVVVNGKYSIRVDATIPASIDCVHVGGTRNDVMSHGNFVRMVGEECYEAEWDE